MKLALIGNSHLACVKAAWRSDAHEATFLGGTAGCGGLGRAWRRLERPAALTLADDAHLFQRVHWRNSVGDRPTLPLDAFDAIVFVGTLVGARPWHLSNCPIEGDVGRLAGYGVGPVSFAQWRAMRAAGYHADLQRWLVEATRTAARPDRRALCVPAPRPRADAAEHDPRYAAPDPWPALPADLRAELARNERALVSRLGAELGVEVVHPPLATLVDGSLCRLRYSEGALGSGNLAGGPPQYGDHPRQHPLNINHKNRAYGAVLVEQIHRALAGRPTEFDPEADP